MPVEWRDDELAAKWKKVRQVRRVVTGALEIERKDKRIGSSLEAAPFVHVTDGAARGDRGSRHGRGLHHLGDLDLAETGAGRRLHPAGSFRRGGGPALAKGTKCARSWRVTEDVGSDPEFPDVSARDAAALKELKELGRL
jgi:isoleucyl-tRNA synthetase